MQTHKKDVYLIVNYSSNLLAYASSYLYHQYKEEKPRFRSQSGGKARPKCKLISFSTYAHLPICKKRDQFMFPVTLAFAIHLIKYLSSFTMKYSFFLVGA